MPSLRSLLCLLVVPTVFACAGPKELGQFQVDKKRSFTAIDARGSFLPTPLDGARLLAKNVELQLPRGCTPLDVPTFVAVAEKVNDVDSDLLAACNILSDDGSSPRKAKVTIVLIRHRISLETGESAAAQMRRAPGVIDVMTTTAGPTAGQSLGPEVVLTTSVPTGPKARPSASVFFGAEDGLYVLYAEVDGDLRSLAAWADVMTATLKPTPSARPIRWRAPTKLSPSATAVGRHKLRLIEGVKTAPSGEMTFGVLVGDAKDPLDARDAGAMFALRDDAGIAVGGNVYTAKLLAPIAGSPMAFARMAADVRGVHDLESKLVASPAGDIARVDGTRKDGSHEVFAAFESEPGEVTVVRMVFTKEKWDAYAPFVDASLSSLSLGPVDDTPY